MLSKKFIDGETGGGGHVQIHAGSVGTKHGLISHGCECAECAGRDCVRQDDRASAIKPPRISVFLQHLPISPFVYLCSRPPAQPSVVKIRRLSSKSTGLTEVQIWAWLTGPGRDTGGVIPLQRLAHSSTDDRRETVSQPESGVSSGYCV